MALLLSPVGRVSFPELFQPKAVNPGDDPKYSVTLLFRPEDMDEAQLKLWNQMKANAQKECKEAFKGAGIGDEYRGKPLSSPFKRSDDKPDWFPPGFVIVRFTTKRKPDVVYGDKSPIEQASGDLYAGCYAHVSYKVFSYDKSGNRGIAFGLGNLQKTGDGERFGDSSSASEDFDVVETAGASSDKYDDDIPF